MFMKKDTQKRHRKIANNIMHYIYKHIDTNLDLEELSIAFNISKFHMLRIFKKEFEQNIYEVIKSIRLQKSSILLLTNKDSTITTIAQMCGYSSHGAFNRVFKTRYKMSPKEWRNNGYKKTLNENIKKVSFNNEPKIVKMGSSSVYYIRHKGYDKNIKSAWEKLNFCLLKNNIKEYKAIGFYHDIPLTLNLEECRYTAGIIIDDENIDLPLAKFIMPEVIYAKFEYKGSYENFFDFINWVHFNWLVNSSYETTPEPSFALYKNCKFLDDNQEFNIEYFVSVEI
ncbi:AraC family transcriptional regulator [Halarcobacter sp.]|uniref:AraC family transcriptional regulator n=1 Tax=Halarcobacter sp. TaxID=2321133 RepID=UPI002AA7E584|nr:AraC family transcriptional regulator [Halarcobacter sp.]